MAECEAPIEKDIVKYALSRGWWHTKFKIEGKRGGPDQLFLRDEITRTRIVFMEMKRPTKEPTEQQKRRHRELRAAGAEVYWVDNREDAYAILD